MSDGNNKAAGVAVDVALSGGTSSAESSSGNNSFSPTPFRARTSAAAGSLVGSVFGLPQIAILVALGAFLLGRRGRGR